MCTVVGHQVQIAESNYVCGKDVCVWFSVFYVSKGDLAVGQFPIEGFLSDTK